jgi:hypothetical protein
VDLLPGRGRSHASAAQGADLGTTRAHTGDPGVGQGIRPYLRGRARLRQARIADPVAVPDQGARSRKGERRSFAETDYAALLDAAHQYLKAPIVVIWDNLNVHLSTLMRELAAARDWLHVIQLPAYSPDLNPTEAVWSHVKRSLGNLAVAGVDHLAAIVRNRLKRIQYRPDLLASFVTHTGLTLEPQPPP